MGGALIGGLAGKYMGHHFDTNELKALTVNMGPNTSAIIVVVEDKQIEEMEKALDEYGAKVVTVTMGSQLSGEMATYAAVSLGENAETAEEPQSSAPAAAAGPRSRPAPANSGTPASHLLLLIEADPTWSGTELGSLDLFTMMGLNESI